MYADAMAAATRRQSDAEITPRVQEPKSRHIVNMVTYIIYINEKQQNKPLKNNFLQALPWIRCTGSSLNCDWRPAAAGTLGERGRGRPSTQVLTL